MDLVIPDWAYVQEHEDRLLAVLFTHGHEDHIGGLPYLLMGLALDRKLRIYGSRLTLGLIGVKLREFGLVDRVEPIAVEPGRPFELGPFDGDDAGAVPLVWSRRQLPDDPTFFPYPHALGQAAMGADSSPSVGSRRCDFDGRR